MRSSFNRKIRTLFKSVFCDISFLDGTVYSVYSLKGVILGHFPAGFVENEIRDMIFQYI